MSTLLAVLIAFTCGVASGAISVIYIIREARGDFDE